MSFLSKYKTEEVELDPFKVSICQVEPAGEEFVVTVKPMTLKAQKRIFEKVGQTIGGARGTDRSLEKANRKFYESLIVGWEGLTAANFNWLCRRSGVKLEPGQVVDFDAGSDGVWFMFENTLFDECFGKVSDALSEWQEKAQPEGKS